MVALSHGTSVKKENNYTIETKFNQYGNKISIFETVKEVDWEIVTKDNNNWLTRNTTDLLLSVDFHYSDEMKISLIIEGDVTENKEYILQLKDDCVFLLNNVKITLHYKPIEKYREKHRYEQAVNECKKWHGLIKTVVGRNTTVLSKKN